jgi:NAD(P)-dependent dehydrogenase (short-subunit alcohol dehydrogenase family)
MNGKVVLVTGANSGIGKFTALGLAELGASVVMTARDRHRGAAAVEEVKAAAGHDRVFLLIGDFASLADVRRLADAFRERHDRLDVLVNNAGLIQTTRSETVDGYETIFAVNHLAPFLLTNLLEERLIASAPARVVNVSSRAHEGRRIDFDDLQSRSRFEPMGVYGTSKLANILFTIRLAERLEGTGVTANALHPGVVRTGFGLDGDAGGLLGLGIKIGRPLFMGSKKGARTSIFLASAPEVEGVTGRYFEKCREARCSAEARDRAVARRLWEVSEELVGLSPAAGR